MTNRPLGMIPGLQPPEGVPETPKGFARLPTASELHGIVKDWFVNRSNFLSASAVQEFDITPEERQELVEVYKKVTEQSIEEPEFDKNELKVLDTNQDVNWYAAIYTHIATGLKIGLSDDQHILDGSCNKEPRPGTMNVLKHLWVEAWCTGELCEYYVEKVDDLPALISILQNTECSGVALVASEDFINAALVKF